MSEETERRLRLCCNTVFFFLSQRWGRKETTQAPMREGVYTRARTQESGRAASRRSRVVHQQELGLGSRS
jgi:hypothetical protein